MVFVVALLIYLLRLRRRLRRQDRHARREHERAENAINSNAMSLMPMVPNPWAPPYMMTSAPYMAPDPALMRLEWMRQQAEMADTAHRFTELPTPRRPARQPAGNPTIGHTLPSPNASSQRIQGNQNAQ